MVEISKCEWETNAFDILMSASKLESVDQIRDSLRPHYKYLVDLYENKYLPIEQDYRSGHDTYGYSNIESITCTLFYISDRWGCGWRLRWLIELINPNYVFYEDRINEKYEVL